jgi:hypothetical protein
MSTIEEGVAAKGKPNPGHVLDVTVFAPRHPDPVKFSFPRDMTVGGAAMQVAEKFGYASGTPTLQNHKGEVLDRNKTLHDEHVRDRNILELVDVGAGV